MSRTVKKQANLVAKHMHKTCKPSKEVNLFRENKKYPVDDFENDFSVDTGIYVEYIATDEMESDDYSYVLDDNI